jgi:alkylhydroperoxidase/carboxymuconolactone decarboxylase family protein YurZ
VTQSEEFAVDKSLIEEIAAYYGESAPAREEYELLASYCPGVVDGYLKTRRALFRDEGTALTPKVRELVILGILIAMKKTNPPPVSHTLKAVEYGANAAEIAEVVSLCIMLGGMVTYRESGRFVLRAAHTATQGEH